MEWKNEILCIIPARGGSKRIKNKNIKALHGKPLISWTIDEAKKSRFIKSIIVSTDDKKIAEICRNSSVEVMDRPDALATDTAATSDVILDLLRVLGEKSYQPDHILLLQCTSPLRTVKEIDEAIEYYLSNIEKADSLISVTEAEHPPFWTKVFNSDGYLVDFIQYDKSIYRRSQDFKGVYRLNGAIYLCKTDKFIEFKDFETPRTLSYIMDPINSIDIDTDFDFLLAESIFKYKEKGNLDV